MDLALRTAVRSFQISPPRSDAGTPADKTSLVVTARRLAARTSTPLAASPNVGHPVSSVHAGVGSSASRSLQESPSHSDAGTPAGKTDLIVTARCRATPTSTSIAPVGNKSAAPPPSPRTRPFACRSLEKSTSTRRRWHTKQQEGHCRDRQTPGYAPHPHTSPPPPRPSRSPSHRHHHPQPRIIALTQPGGHAREQEVLRCNRETLATRLSTPIAVSPKPVIPSPNHHRRPPQRRRCLEEIALTQRRGHSKEQNWPRRDYETSGYTRVDVQVGHRRHASAVIIKGCTPPNRQP